jgi:sulfur-oxidizing protein SoxY
MCASFDPRLDRRDGAARTDAARADAGRRAAEVPASNRREALKYIGAALLACGVLPWRRTVAVENDALAFGSGSLEGALSALGASLDSSTQIQLVVPDFVENGSVVPVEVTSQLQGPQTIFVLSEANPFPLVARFAIPEGTDPYVSTRIKVAQSCNIYAVVQAGDRFYSAVKPTTVTVGGCGNG